MWNHGAAEMCRLMNGNVMMNGTCIIPTSIDSRLLGIENVTDSSLIMTNLSTSTLLPSTVGPIMASRRTGRGIMPSFEYFQFVFLFCVIFIVINVF